MSLSDFAHPSKYSNNHVRSHIHSDQRKERTWKEMNNLIHRIRHATAKSSYLDNFIEENKDDDNSFLSLIESRGQIMPPTSHQKRRPWTAPHKMPLVRDLFPDVFAELEGFEQAPEINDENCPPSDVNHAYSPIGKLNVSITSIHERPKWSSKTKMDRRIKTTKTCRTKCRRTKSSLVEYKLENKENLLQRRNERIEQANFKRKTMYLTREKTLAETINKKEQRRLKNNRIKETELRQQETVRAIILAASLQRWLRNAPETLANFKREKSQKEAAEKIQNMWRKDNFARKAFETCAVKKKLKRSGWRIILYMRCNRRRLYAKVIRSFLLDLLVNALPFVFVLYRSRILRAQKHMRNFIECKRKRLKALEEMWVRESSTVEEIQSKRRRRKNVAYRQILSKGMVGIVKRVAREADGRPSSVSIQTTPRDHYEAFCQFYLEDSRRLHIIQSSNIASNISSGIPKVTCNDAKTLLSGRDVEMVVKCHPAKSKPMFLLFYKKDIFRKKIEGFCQNQERDMLEIHDRLKLRLNRSKRYANGSPLLCQSSDGDKSLKEIKEIFNLIDKDSKGYLSRGDVEGVFDLIGVNMQRAHVPWNASKLEFESVVDILQTGTKRKMRHTTELILQAFDFFASKQNVKVKGHIKKPVLLNALQSYGHGKWNEIEAIESLSSLRGAGFNERNINYKSLVECVRKERF